MSRTVRSRGGRGLRLEQLEPRETPAAVGTLDPSFGTGGKVTTTFGNDDRAASIALQSDGKIVVAGTSAVAGGSTIVVIRYNPDGSIDGSFGTSGRTAINFLGFDRAAGVAIGADGKIVVVGTGTPNGAPPPGGPDSDIVVARLNTDGSLDNTFDGDGKATVNFAPTDSGTAVAIRPDGRVLVVGTNGGAGSDFVAAQFTATGGLDNTFDGDGKATFDFGGTDAANAVALMADGRAVLAGATSASGSDNFAVQRITATGQSDNTFSGDGKATVDFGLDDVATGVVVYSDGRVLAAGYTAGTADDFAVTRLTADGNPDPGFNTTGKVVVTFGGVDRGSGVALQPDGRIVVAGSTNVNGGDMAVLRLNPNGFLDTSFGPGGIRTVDVGANDSAAAVALTPTGRIVLAGATLAAPQDFALARLIGTVELGRNLVASGTPNGMAAGYTPNSGIYSLSIGYTIAPFGATTANIRTAVGDVNGDGFQDTVAVTGPGITVRFAVVSGRDNTTLLVPPTAPFSGSETFTGGAFVAVADFDNDGRAEIVISPDEGGGPRVTIFSLLPTGLFQRANFLGIDDINFRGGARVAAGDVNADAVADLAVAAGYQGGPRVALYNGRSLFTSPTRLVNDFFAFPADAATLRNGAYVAVGDVDGDGFGDLIFGGGPGGAPRVRILSGAQVSVGNTGVAIANFFVAGNTSDRGGIRVVAKDADADNRADVAVGTGQGVVSRVRVYFGNTFVGTGEPTGFQDLDPFSGAPLAGGVYVG